jgi:DNA-binding CsgD family transcriptional regulator
MVEIEQREPDYNKFVALAREPVPAASLSQATEGRLERSRRQRELRRPSGFADELRLVLRDDTGTWGALTLLRERTSPDFSGAEVRFAASLATTLADGLRRALLRPTSADAADGDTHGPGLLVLAPDGRPELADREARYWLDRLSGRGDLATVVRNVADRVRRDGHAGLARARTRTRDGVWLLVRGSLLGEPPDAPIGIHFEPVRGAELAPVLVAAYGLTDRERAVTELVCRGLTTSEMAAALHLSAYTVQDHLKSIFDKTGTGSRGELVAHLLVDHLQPRPLLG